MKQSVKQRIIQYIEYIGISKREFERTIGVANAYLANLVSHPKDEVIESIIQHFPNLNRVWLLTGEGNMLNEENHNENTEVNDNTTLLLPTSARGGSLVDFATSVSKYECESVISPIKGIDFAMTVTGDSMAPEYPHGSRIFIKKINEMAFIDWGRVYVLDTCNGAVIKKIMPGSTSECVRCVSLNKEYPDFEVQFADMYGMYRVLLLLTEK